MMIKILIKILILMNINMYVLCMQTPYYNNPNIHNFGNVGLGGKFHAYLAPYATKLIDKVRYNNIDLRQELLKTYDKYYYNTYNRKAKIVDLCCGVGMSTHNSALGIDTSPEMINRAKKLHKNRFIIGNAEYYGATNEFDVSTIIFALHEMPSYGYKNVIKNAKYISRNEILVMDISPNYTPSKIMLSGEPYLENYKKNIDNYLKSENFKSINLIDNHVTLWHYKNEIK
jgi:ubiquinone/menaquinone biosynthesis C-methylase UbiE